MEELAEWQVRCVKCHRDLDASEFSPSKIAKSRKSGTCRKCVTLDQTARREKAKIDSYQRKEAALPDGIDDETSLLAFGPPEKYLEYIKNITEKSGTSFLYRKSGRGKKPKGLE